MLGLHVAHMCIEQLVELLRMCEERDSADLAVAKAVYYLVDIFDSLIHAQKAPEVCEVLRCAAHFPFAMCAAISVEETSLLFELRLQLCVAQGWPVFDGGWFVAPPCLSLRLCPRRMLFVDRSSRHAQWLEAYTRELLRESYAASELARWTSREEDLTDHDQLTGAMPALPEVETDMDSEVCQNAP